MKLFIPLTVVACLIAVAKSQTKPEVKQTKCNIGGYPHVNGKFEGATRVLAHYYDSATTDADFYKAPFEIEFYAQNRKTPDFFQFQMLDFDGSGTRTKYEYGMCAWLKPNKGQTVATQAKCADMANGALRVFHAKVNQQCVVYNMGMLAYQPREGKEKFNLGNCDGLSCGDPCTIKSTDLELLQQEGKCTKFGKCSINPDDYGCGDGVVAWIEKASLNRVQPTKPKSVHG